MKKTLLPLLLLFFVVMTLVLTLSASAEEITSGSCGANIEYILDDEGTLTISGSGDMTDWQSYLYVPWYSQRYQIKKVVISDGITSIGNYAFLNCVAMTDITIPSTITSIGHSAFYYCTGLSQINLPANLKTIGNWAFSYCESLTSITIHAGITDIGYCAFYRCTSLERISVNSNNKNYASDTRGALFNKNKSILICYPAGNPNTFYSIPSSVTSIENYAFCHTEALTTITVTDNLKTIKSKAFFNTAYYTTANRENGVLYIGNCLINAASSVSGDCVIKNGTKTIADNAFENCHSLKSIIIPDSVKNIGSFALRECTEINVSANNPYYSSDDCGVLFNKDKTVLIKYPSKNTRTSYTIPSSVTSISEYAFSYCDNLTNITFENGSQLASVEKGAFSNCQKLSLISLPVSTTNIGSYAFDSCHELKSITLPAGVTEIGNYTFFSCSNLTIKGHDGSFAQTYAENIGIPFEALAIVYGDISGDGAVDVSDVIKILQMLAGSDFSSLAKNQKVAADVNGDESIDVSDVIRILQFLASPETQLKPII